MFKLIIISYLAFTIEASAQLDSIITYYDNGKIESVVHMRDKVRDGDAKFYWVNGNLKEELSYVNGRIEGFVRRYNENGTLKEMFLIENGKREGPTSLFDSTGKYVRDIFYEEGILVVDKVVLDDGGKKDKSKTADITPLKSSQIQNKNKQQNTGPLPPTIEEEKNYENDSAFYTAVEIMPEPYGGMNAIYKKIGYPEKAKENGIEGIVKILALIDRDGEVLDANVIEGIGYGCDEAARLAILYHRFKPGLIKGQKVKVKMEIPIEFKLEERN